MEWPQYIMLALYTLQVFFGVANAAKKSDAVAAVASILAPAFLAWVLYMGGFFSGAN